MRLVEPDFMKIKLLFLPLLAGIILGSCSGDRTIEKFSAEKPYTVKVSKQRSLYHAEKLANRLNDMDLDAFVIQYEDSIEGDGSWYYVFHSCSAFLDSAISERSRIEKKFELDDLETASYNNFKGAILDIELLKDNEIQQITSAKPNINEDIYKVLAKFPESNALVVKESTILNTPKDPGNKKGFSSIYSLSMDLPRGIDKNLMLEECTAVAEVIYEDNLYGDQVTIDIAKLRPSPDHLTAGISDDSRKEILEIASRYADLILETGRYSFEDKKELNIEAYDNLYGYKVTIEPKRGYFRTYLILIDTRKEFMIFSQSTDKTEDELLEILNDIGIGAGLTSFGEFYNAFYTMPQNAIDGDEFICFSIDKLGWRYAKSRGYVNWSKEMVGHWQSQAFYYNEKKGSWSYSIFDLLTKGKQDYIYGDLYAKNRSSNKYSIDVYGTEGFVIYTDSWSSSRRKYYKKTSEISFGKDRFISAVGNTEKSWFSKEELLERAESLQFSSESIEL